MGVWPDAPADQPGHRHQRGCGVEVCSPRKPDSTGLQLKRCPTTNWTPDSNPFERCTGNASRRLEPDYGVLHRELRRKGVTLQLLWEEYVEAHPGLRTYRYTQFCQNYKDWADAQALDAPAAPRRREAVRRLRRPDRADPRRATAAIAFHAHVFVAVLGASNYTFAVRDALADDCRLDRRACAARFEFIGGVPELLVPDNPQALIARADRYEPELDRTTQDFANHYATAMLPARPRKPQDKAKVEVGVQIVERWILARLRNHRSSAWPS